MATVCEINDKFLKSGIGGTLIDLPTGSSIKAQGAGAYHGSAGHVTDSPDATASYIYHVMVVSPTESMIVARDIKTGHEYIMPKVNNTWGTSWTPTTIDLSNYYTKPEADAKTKEIIHTTPATTTTNGGIKMRLSGSTLYMTNNGSNP